MNQRWFFSPGLQVSFTSQHDFTYHQHEEGQLRPNYLEDGISDTAKDNEQYKLLIQNISTVQMSSWRLFEDMIIAFNIKGIKWPLNEDNDFKTYSESEFNLFQWINSLKLLKIPNQIVFKTWADYFWMKYSKEKILLNNSITESEYKLII